MKLLSAFRAMGAAFALVLVGAAAFAAFVNDAPNGPSLGTPNVNPFTLGQAILFNNGANSGTLTPTTTVQATCQVINAAMTLINGVLPSGSLCLPPAYAGRELFIGNTTGQTLNIFGSNTPFVSTTQDTINGTAGSSAYTGLTTGKNAQCFSPSNGVWFCSSGS